MLWQTHHVWPTLEFVRNVRQGLLAEIPRSLLLLCQLLYQNPVSVPI
jgi:hypothetical protein